MRDQYIWAATLVCVWILLGLAFTLYFKKKIGKNLFFFLCVAANLTFLGSAIALRDTWEAAIVAALTAYAIWAVVDEKKKDAKDKRDTSDAA